MKWNEWWNKMKKVTEWAGMKPNKMELNEIKWFELELNGI